MVNEKKQLLNSEHNKEQKRKRPYRLRTRRPVATPVLARLVRRSDVRR